MMSGFRMLGMALNMSSRRNHGASDCSIVVHVEVILVHEIAILAAFAGLFFLRGTNPDESDRISPSKYVHDLSTSMNMPAGCPRYRPPTPRPRTP